jgi:CspA family cold shock protein
MPTGTVKFFNADKGYGFIAPEDGGPDVFLHASALEAAGIRSVSDGDRISFYAVMDERRGKTNAQNIKKLWRAGGVRSKNSAAPMSTLIVVSVLIALLCAATAIAIDRLSVWWALRSKRMATRHARRAEFPSETDRQVDRLFEVLCEDNRGTYVLPFVCCWHEGQWWNESKSLRIDATVIGWRPPAKKGVAREL